LQLIPRMIQHILSLVALHQREGVPLVVHWVGHLQTDLEGHQTGKEEHRTDLVGRCQEEHQID